MINRREDGGGMGYFAFNPKYHLDENSELIATSEKLRATRVNLFRDWAYYWYVKREIFILFLQKYTLTQTNKHL